MSRTGNLLSLSREHHLSLVMARTARKAATSGDAAVVSAAIKQMEAHWQSVLAEHFAQEEVMLRDAVGTLSAEAVARILAEHAALRALACESHHLDCSLRLHRFGELLAQHVRYEERELFPVLQSPG